MAPDYSELLSPSLGSSFGNSAIFIKRPAAFRPLLKTTGNIIRWEEHVNQKNQILKIILFSVSWNQIVSARDKDSLICLRNVGLRGEN